MKKILTITILLFGLTVFSQDIETIYKVQIYKLDTLSINTPNSDFGVSYIDDDQVVFSAPKKNELFARKWKENGQTYLELYKGKLTKKGSVIDVEKYSKDINSKYHESQLVFSQDKKVVYFTSNNQIKGKGKRSSSGYNNLQLYKADVVSGEYKNIQKLPFNNREYSTGHPFLVNNDKTLFFVSDRPGGFGQTDLYKVAVLGNNMYGDVVNLGSRINTPSKEMFPFLDVDGTLYFSSDRPTTKGGLDVYGISLVDNKEEMYQLPSPINSEQDDFAFVLGKYQFGFLSSNRKGGEGDDDIYKLELDCLQYLSGVVYNKNNNTPLNNVKVYIQKENKLIDSVLTDNKGVFNSSILASCNTNYVVEATKPNFKKDSTEIQTSAFRAYNNHVRLNLEPSFCEQKLLGVVRNTKTKDVVSLANVYLYSKNKFIDSVKTNEKGMYEFPLSLVCNTKYHIKAEKKYFKIDLKKLQTSSVDNFENVINLNLEPYIIDNKIVIDPIYFDLDKFFIRPDAAKILDGVVEVMNKYPNLVIEGGSHTDSRGNDTYNKSLSSKRAKSTVAYIISKGISPDRITSKGYGETRLINRCTNGVKCSKKEHQLNRRTEFKIIKR